MRVLFGVLIVAFALLSCASAPDTADTADAPRESAPAATPETVPAEARDRTFDSLMRDLLPRSGRPVFLGISPRLHNRDEEIDRAILHAAEQASRYTRMFSKYQLVTQRGGRSFGYLEDIRADWDADFADRLVDSVEVLESLQDEHGTYVIATAEGIPDAPAIGVQTTSGNGEPQWVSRPPEIPGFLVTVGLTQRSRRRRDSIDTADQEALKEILLQAGSTVRLMEERRDVERMGTLETTTAAQDAEATLRQFLVLARYATRDGRYFYSLVIAREE